VLGVFYTLVFMATSSIAAPFAVEVVLDGSESMLQPVAGSTIQTKVREAVITTISEAEAREDDLVIGLRVAGGDACSVPDPLVPIGPPEWNRWTKALSGVHPKGKRPLFQTVASAVADVAGSGARSRVVVITAGGDQCGAGIEQIAAAMSSSHGAVEVRLIGLNLDPSTLTSFGSVQVRNATDPSQLLDAVRWGVLESEDPGADAAAADPTPTAVPATLTAPSEIAAGAEIELTWSGPEGAEDFLSIARTGSTDDDYIDWARVDEGNPTRFTAPLQPGTYELRYVDGETGEVRVRSSLEVVAPPIELRAPVTATAGLRFEVAWNVNSAAGEFVAITRRGPTNTPYLDWATTATGSPVTLAAPTRPGIYEIRYYARGGLEILDRVEIEVRP
jgi:Ca-activated chloride channel family protein